LPRCPPFGAAEVAEDAIPGSFLVQYLNSQGQVVLWVDADGVLRIKTIDAQGAVLQIGPPSSD